MKRKIKFAALALAVVMLWGCSGCQALSRRAKTSVAEVEAAIEAIGQPITPEMGAELRLAEELYYALSSEDRAKVTNGDVLESALVQLDEMEIDIDTVIDLIEAIGDVTFSKEPIIRQARTNYTVLDSVLRKYVTNYDDLTEAEMAYGALEVQRAKTETKAEFFEINNRGRSSAGTDENDDLRKAVAYSDWNENMDEAKTRSESSPESSPEPSPEPWSKITISGYKGIDTVVVIPEEIDDEIVSVIGYEAFKGNTTITRVTIPATVEEISTGAFEDCIALKEVTMLGEIKIGARAFKNCTSLETISVNGYIGSYAFKNCKNLKVVEFGENVTKCDATVFEGCTSLEEVRVSENNKHFEVVDGVLYRIDGSRKTTVFTFQDEAVTTGPEMSVDNGENAEPTSEPEMLEKYAVTVASQGGLNRLALRDDAEKITKVVADEDGISDLSALSGLTNLIELDLGFNNISNLSPLVSLTNLTKLYLNSNNIGDISALSGLTNLTKLYLNSNNISDISALGSLTNLRTLYLSSNDISDLSPLSRLTNLTELSLSGNDISDVSALSNLTNLERLSLKNNQLTQQQIDELQEKLPNCDIRFD